MEYQNLPRKLVKIIRNYKYRQISFMVGCCLLHIGLSSAYLILGIIYHSMWYIELMLYYLLLSSARTTAIYFFFKVRNKSREEKLKAEIKGEIIIGIIFILIAAVTLAITLYFITNGLKTRLPLFLFYVTAIHAIEKLVRVSYAFISRFAKFKNVQSPMISAIKALSVVEGFISLFIVSVTWIGSYDISSRGFGFINTLPILISVAGINVIHNAYIEKIKLKGQESLY